VVFKRKNGLETANDPILTTLCHTATDQELAFCHFDRRGKSQDPSHWFGMTRVQLLAVSSMESEKIIRRG